MPKYILANSVIIALVVSGCVAKEPCADGKRIYTYTKEEIEKVSIAKIQQSPQNLGIDNYRARCAGCHWNYCYVESPAGR